MLTLLLALAVFIIVWFCYVPLNSDWSDAILTHIVEAAKILILPVGYLSLFWYPAMQPISDNYRNSDLPTWTTDIICSIFVVVWFATSLYDH